MKIILIEQVSQAKDWVNAFLPKIYHQSRMNGEMSDGTVFMLVLREHAWMDRIRGLTVTSYSNLSNSALSLTEEAFIKAKIWKPNQLILEAYEHARTMMLDSYRSYQLVLIKDGEKHDLVYVDGCGPLQTYVREQKIVLKEVAKEVEKFEKIFNVRAIQETYSKKVTTTEEWVKQ